jgi:hypothetical protein
VAGAAIPRAISPTVPNKNFFMILILICHRFVEANHFGTGAHRIWGKCSGNSSRRLYPKYNTRL